MRLLPMGASGVLVTDLSVEPSRWADAVRRRAAFLGLVEIVPAAETVLVTVEHPARLAPVCDELRTITAEPDVNRADGCLEIAIDYDGVDLAAVADACRLSVPEVIRHHSGAEYRVAFTGFAPGFGYLVGLPASLQLPRRAEPRPKVPAGSVAIANQYAAVYPRSSPGGWHLIGTSDIELFDPDRDPPTPLIPGRRVRFVAR